MRNNLNALIIFIQILILSSIHSFGQVSIIQTPITEVSDGYEVEYCNESADTTFWMWISPNMEKCSYKDQIEKHFFNDFKHDINKSWLYYMGIEFVYFGDTLSNDNFVVRIFPHEKFSFVSDEKFKIENISKHIIIIPEVEVLKLHRALTTILDPPTIFYDRRSIFVNETNPIILYKIKH